MRDLLLIDSGSDQNLFNIIFSFIIKLKSCLDGQESFFRHRSSAFQHIKKLCTRFLVEVKNLGDPNRGECRLSPEPQLNQAYGRLGETELFCNVVSL